MIKQLAVENFGPLKRADIEFGDLTVLVGPQASGKSLFVQTLKAMCDGKAIREDLLSYGFDWRRDNNPVAGFCGAYFGGGMESIVSSSTRLVRDKRELHPRNFYNSGEGTETVFLIPAQRVLVLQDGWPRPSMGYQYSDPYSIKHYSEQIRRQMERGLERANAIFPQEKRFKKALREEISKSIYVGGALKQRKDGGKKRIVLAQGRKGVLAQGAWSAGQREFTPLLLGLYWLVPSTRQAKPYDELDMVVLEEPEMGLHPKAIVTFGALVLELLDRGYRVVVSTHSPVILDLVWALRALGTEAPTRAIAYHALNQIFFGTPEPALTPPMQRLFDSGLGAEIRTYLFRRRINSVVTKEISSLDPGSEDSDVAGWGGLSGFSGRIAELVGEAIR